MTLKSYLDKPAFVSWVRAEFGLTRAELAALPHDDFEECVEMWHEFRNETMTALEFFCD